METLLLLYALLYEKTYPLVRFERYAVAGAALFFNWPSRQCLNRRVPTQDELEKQVLAWAAERNQKQLTIHWQFTVEKSRETLNKQYVKVNPDNPKYQKT